MTEEEIEKQAEKYFCEHCENGFEHEHGWCSNCSKWDCFIAGAKWGIANATEWHDLRESPNDLPKEGCLIVSMYHNGTYSPVHFYLGGRFNDDVIKWCELPTHKE